MTPVHCPKSPSQEPLDWGSDAELEEYIHLPFLYLMFTRHIESPQCQRNVGLQRDGSCKAKNTHISHSNVLVNTISVPTCKHGQSFALCNGCKGKYSSKIGTLWLLYSRASMHFTHEFSDLIKYTLAPPSEHIPVNTASEQIFVEGKGTVLLEHNVDNKLVTTHLYPVYYIPRTTMQLLIQADLES
jgi:hypothetical protein